MTEGTTRAGGVDRPDGPRTNLPVAQWRKEAIALGGRPDDHPDVPPEYVYTANRLALLIGTLVRQETPTHE
jgi:hypothetical protein